MKGPKQDSQNRLRSPIPEGGEPLIIIHYLGTVNNSITCKKRSSSLLDT